MMSLFLEGNNNPAAKGDTQRPPGHREDFEHDESPVDQYNAYRQIRSTYVRIDWNTAFYEI